MPLSKIFRRETSGGHDSDAERIANIERMSAETDARLVGTAPVAGLTVNRPGFTRIRDEMRRVQPIYDQYDQAAGEALAAAKSNDRAGASGKEKKVTHENAL